jgi:hypothetical protein
MYKMLSFFTFLVIFPKLAITTITTAMIPYLIVFIILGLMFFYEYNTNWKIEFVEDSLEEHTIDTILDEMSTISDLQTRRKLKYHCIEANKLNVFNMIETIPTPELKRHYTKNAITTYTTKILDAEYEVLTEKKELANVPTETEEAYAEYLASRTGKYYYNKRLIVSREAAINHEYATKNSFWHAYVHTDDRIFFSSLDMPISKDFVTVHQILYSNIPENNDIQYKVYVKKFENQKDYDLDSSITPTYMTAAEINALTTTDTVEYRINGIWKPKATDIAKAIVDENCIQAQWLYNMEYNYLEYRKEIEEYEIKMTPEEYEFWMWTLFSYTAGGLMFRQHRYWNDERGMWWNYIKEDHKETLADIQIQLRKIEEERKWDGIRQLRKIEDWSTNVEVQEHKKLTLEDVSDTDVSDSIPTDSR